MSLKTLLLACLASAAVAAAATRYYYPRVDIQTIETTKDVIKTDIRTVTRLIERADGTKETVTETVDNTKRTIKDTKSHTENRQNDWYVVASVNTRLYADDVPSYAIGIHRRIIGPIFAGVQADAKGAFGVAVGLEF